MRCSRYLAAIEDTYLEEVPEKTIPPSPHILRPITTPRINVYHRDPVFYNLYIPPLIAPTPLRPIFSRATLRDPRLRSRLRLFVTPFRKAGLPNDKRRKEILDEILFEKFQSKFSIERESDRWKKVYYKGDYLEILWKWERFHGNRVAARTQDWKEDSRGSGRC